MSVLTEIERVVHGKDDIKAYITEKGVDVPAGTKLDGYRALLDKVKTAKPEQEKTVNITESGTYNVEVTPDAGKTMNKVIAKVDVKGGGTLVPITFDKNGKYNATSYGVDGFNEVNVAVHTNTKPESVLKKTLTNNGPFTFFPPTGEVFNKVEITANVPSGGTNFPNGTEWTQSNVTGNYPSIFNGEGQWLCSGSSGEIYHSNDAVTWEKSINTPAGNIREMKRKNGRWVAGSYGNSEGIVYSNNGITWNKTNITTGDINYFGYGDGRWVAGTKANGIIYSDDGITWNKTNITTGDYGNTKGKRNIHYSDGCWNAACVKSSNGIYYSKDGITWSKTNVTTGMFYCIKDSNGVKVAASKQGLYTSNDGITWDKTISSGDFNSIYAYDGRWVASDSDGIVYFSTNGIDWNVVTFVGEALEYSSLDSVICVDGKWAAWTDSGGLAYSRDGLTWEYSNITSGTFLEINAFNGVWLASGNSGTYWSTDAENWISTNLMFRTKNPVYFNGKWAIGSSRGVYYSIGWAPTV